MAKAKRNATIPLRSSRLTLSSDEGSSEEENADNWGELNDLQMRIRSEWLAKEFRKHFGPESALAAGQNPNARFNVRSLPDRCIISDIVWPSGEIVLTPAEIDHPNFSVRKAINENEEWKAKELTPDSEDTMQTIRMIRRRYCEAIENLTSSLAGIRHADRFEVQMRKDSYLIRDQLRPSFVHEILRIELFEPLTNELLLSRSRRETPSDLEAEEEEMASQDATRSLLKVSLEILLGPETAVLAQMDPTHRFVVRDHNGGFRVFDNCNPDLWLYLTATEVKSGELDLEKMYERATPTFWDTWEKEQKSCRALVRRLIWKHFMDHY
ncbi:MAG TPA: hypothetical protein VGO47_02880, partial [Chlamydiales bacterium]|nr:hypothetical protein [Chlamydiales bacterium]